VNSNVALVGPRLARPLPALSPQSDFRDHLAAPPGPIVVGDTAPAVSPHDGFPARLTLLSRRRSRRSFHPRPLAHPSPALAYSTAPRGEASHPARSGYETESPPHGR